MIYFLVNNDYQLLDANRHARQLRQARSLVSLILVPHALQCAPEPELYEKVERFEAAVRGRRWLAAWPRYFRDWRLLQERIRPTAQDVLVIYTEFELLNHCAVLHFRSAGAKVIHIEDGGVGTYVPFANVESQRLTLRERLIAWMTRRLPGMADTTFKKINGVVFPWRPDSQIDVLCVYRKFQPARHIRTVTIKNDAEAAEIHPVAGRVVFLNECIYDHYQDAATYLDGLNHILKALTAGYREVFFKFHPRETSAWRDRIQSRVLSKYPEIQMIQESAPFELLLSRYEPEALASYFATPLLNLAGTGVEPLFVFHLLKDLRNQPVFAQLATLLHGWNYRFARDWTEVRAGYRSHIDFNDTTPCGNFQDLLHSLQDSPLSAQ